ncbi:acyltransferase [Cellulomonas sp. WB94]|uniref:acyltransferase n=1 Tax=Cellulomonas sp. WB94 TaxID=2173174 RepID=UPI002413BC6F|nr:acyltransferase [Cellulomonas sp. WB94]
MTLAGPGASAREPLAADFAAWDFDRLSDKSEKGDQRERLAGLRSRGYVVGEGCVVSGLAAVHPDRLVLGDRSYVAAHAHVTGDVEIGEDCSVNVAAVVRGRVRLGRAVRVGAQAALLGFDHGFDDTSTEIYRQPLSSIGIDVGDDVWIGSHAMVLDGVRIGSHAVVGAAAVVTRDVPAGAVVVGNPARVVRRRGVAGPVVRSREQARQLGEQARAQVGEVIERAWSDGLYRDSPGATPTVRAHADAVELAVLLTMAPPTQLSREEHVERLRGVQHADTGLVDELVGGRWPDVVTGPDASARLPVRDLPVRDLPDQERAYHVLSVGYALDLLGSSFAHPVRAITELDAPALVGLLDALPWRTEAWGSGALVDAVGTALTWQLRAGRPAAGLAETLAGWAMSRRDPGSGLWGLTRRTCAPRSTAPTASCAGRSRSGGWEPGVYLWWTPCCVERPSCRWTTA